jgi:hypothetical protein
LKAKLPEDPFLVQLAEEFSLPKMLEMSDHFHVHLVPRWPEDGWSHWHGSLISDDIEEIKATAEKIKASV